jgi:hypothetical protein
MADKPSFDAKVAAWRVIYQILAEHEAAAAAAAAAQPGAEQDATLDEGKQ